MRHRQIIIEEHANSFVIILNKWRTDNNTNLEIKSSVLQKELAVTQSKIIRDIKAVIYNKIYKCNHPIEHKLY